MMTTEQLELTPEVLLVKLASGEEIIGKVVELNEGASQVESPLVVVMRPDNSGGVSISFIPFMALAENDTVLLMRMHVQAIAKPKEETIKNYLRAIGDTLIETPPEKKILLS